MSTAAMEAALHQEVLLVCTALGSIEAIEEPGKEGRLVCAERGVWLQDLQRRVRAAMHALCRTACGCANTA